MYQASSEAEQLDIKRVLGTKKVILLPNLRSRCEIETTLFKGISKNPEELRICLVARINQIKNIDKAIRWVNEINHKGITFDIFGFIEDDQYFQKCKMEMDAFSDSVIRFRGGLESVAVIHRIQDYHLFFLPTQGENFGHSILEAFIAGRPVLISDRTPWTGLSSVSAGFDLPLDGFRFKEAITFFLAMNDVEFGHWMEGARKKAEDYYENKELIRSYISIFK